MGKLGRANKVWVSLAGYAAELAAARWGHGNLWSEVATAVAGLLAVYAVPNKPAAPKPPAA